MIRLGMPLMWLGLLAASARGVELTAGPMVGAVTDKSVRVWMQFPIAGEVTINCFEVERNQGVSGMKFGLEGPTPFVCDVPINGLQPNRTYRIEVKFDGEPVKLPGPELVLRTAPAPGEEATFSVAFGSGIGVMPMGPVNGAATQAAGAVFKPHKLPIFSAIAETKPRAFFFLGNMGLLPEKLEEFPLTHKAAFRYFTDFHSLLRREPDMQGLLRTTPCYGVLGERDFGPLGSDGRYVYTPESLLAFQRYWPNPDWGTPANPGCFSMCSLGDVDFFLLDARTFRTDKEMLGAPQLEWLEKNLKASKATFKILGAPCTLWGDEAGRPYADSWTRYPAEQLAFVAWLGANQINGVVAMAGNQSAGELTKGVAGGGGRMGYPLFSLGCSTLAASGPGVARAGENVNRQGQAVEGDTFGTLDFTGTREHRTLTLRLHDATGKTRVEQVLLAKQVHN